MKQQTLSPDLAEAGRFLDLFGEGEPHTFQYFDDTKKTKTAAHLFGHLDDVAPRLTTANRRGCGVFFMVNAGDGKSRTAANVTAVRALFVDLDGSPVEPVHAAPLEPHAVVESSPGKFQAYWLVEGCEKERFTALQTAMAKRFGGDGSVKDLPRVMRVPGFFHRKSVPFRVRTVRLEPGLPYGIDQLVERLGLRDVEEKAAREAAAPLQDIDELAPKSIPPGKRHETLLRYAYKYACENFPRGTILLLVNGINHTACTEPKPYEEVVAIVDSALRKVPHVNTTKLLEKAARQPPVVVPAEDVFCPPEEAAHEEEGIALTFALPEELLVSAPGLTGEIANWITESNIYWQPSYSLAAALAFVGMLKGHNVRTEQDGRTNLLTVAVGPSSSGKTIPLKRIQLLARKAGLSHRMCGEPMSEQGMVKGLIEAGHKALIPWDEIGLAFKGMFSSYAPSFKSGIVRLILKVYSMADETVLGFQYANGDGKTPRADLVQPCLCLYGTTTQEGIFGAFSSVEAVNGFAARLLIFETHDYLAPRQPVGDYSPSDELIEKVRAMSGEFVRKKGNGNLSGIMREPIPRVVPFTPEARELFKLAGRKFEGLKHAAIKGKRPAEESIWGRAYEQATKVALTVEDGPAITHEAAAWAIELVTALCLRMIVAARDQIADNQTHAELNSVLKLIKQAHPQWVDSTYLCRRTRALPLKKRKELLASLVEEGTVEIKQSSTNGRKKTLFRYVR